MISSTTINGGESVVEPQIQSCGKLLFGSCKENVHALPVTCVDSVKRCASIDPRWQMIFVGNSSTLRRRQHPSSQTHTAMDPDSNTYRAAAPAPKLHSITAMDIPQLQRQPASSKTQHTVETVVCPQLFQSNHRSFPVPNLHFDPEKIHHLKLGRAGEVILSLWSVENSTASATSTKLFQPRLSVSESASNSSSVSSSALRPLGTEANNADVPTSTPPAFCCVRWTGKHPESACKGSQPP